jgi:Flp pilus assembly protein TadD
MSLNRMALAWLPIVLLAVLVIYIPGLGNTPVFDDSLLTSGQLFADYGTLSQLKPRWLSYGSFVWLQEVLGEGWGKQRIANLAVHLAVILALWGLYREILQHIAPEDSALTGAQVSEQSFAQSPALGLAIGVFALNPVAVYAVAYLIQRSILLATFFVVLGLWLCLKGIARNKPVYFIPALIAYILALLSKEHALMAPLAALPLYVLAARPSAKKLALLVLGGSVLIALAGAFLSWRYGEIIGKPFDEFSRIYLAQLAQLGPDVEKNAYGLSLLNQSYLFFKYGFNWMLPYVGWMSIDLRPPFPITWITFPHLLGALGYLAVLAGGATLLIRYRDWRALIGVSVLIPAILFMTEFVTVWVQDPFVLYRSYLWAIGIPGLAFFVFQGFSPRVLVALGLGLTVLFTGLAHERVASMASPQSVWSDAIAKLPDDPRSVGRWFPYLNRGNLALEQGDLRGALADFQASARLGDQGMGAFNIGALLFQNRQYDNALRLLDQAEAGGFKLPSLHYQRGITLRALGRLNEAYQAFERALTLNPGSPEREEILALKGQLGLDLGINEQAESDIQAALAINPRHKKARLAHGMAMLARHDFSNAAALFSELLQTDQYPPLYYGRALAHEGLKHRAEALADIDKALRLDPRHPAWQDARARIAAMP